MELDDVRVEGRARRAVHERDGSDAEFVVTAGDPTATRQEPLSDTRRGTLRGGSEVAQLTANVVVGGALALPKRQPEVMQCECREDTEVHHVRDRQCVDGAAELSAEEGGVGPSAPPDSSQSSSRSGVAESATVKERGMRRTADCSGGSARWHA